LDFKLTQEQLIIRDTVRRLVHKELEPGAVGNDRVLTLYYVERR
jgi:hypothetical protein